MLVPGSDPTCQSLDFFFVCLVFNCVAALCLSPASIIFPSLTTYYPYQTLWSSTDVENHLPRVHKYCVKMENVTQVTCVLYYSYLILVKSLLILLVVMLNGGPACPEYQYLLFFPFVFIVSIFLFFFLFYTLVANMSYKLLRMRFFIIII